MKLYKKVLLAIGIMFIAIQFFRPSRNVNAALLQTDITNTIDVPEPVMAVLKNSCYDCHSNNTRYPWYMNIQPIAWFLANHIKDGKKNLNFSEFGSYSLRRRQNKLKAIAEEAESGDMPLSSYTMIHSGAKLSDSEKKLINDWAQSTSDKLSANK